MNHISLKKGKPRCYAKSPTVQDTFWQIPGIISCTGMTSGWEVISHAQNAVRWLVLSVHCVSLCSCPSKIYDQNHHVLSMHICMGAEALEALQKVIAITSTIASSHNNHVCIVDMHTWLIVCLHNYSGNSHIWLHAVKSYIASTRQDCRYITVLDVMLVCNVLFFSRKIKERES